MTMREYLSLRYASIGRPDREEFKSHIKTLLQNDSGHELRELLWQDILASMVDSVYYSEIQKERREIVSNAPVRVANERIIDEASKPSEIDPEISKDCVESKPHPAFVEALKRLSGEAGIKTPTAETPEMNPTLAAGLANFRGSWLDYRERGKRLGEWRLRELLDLAEQYGRITYRSLRMKIFYSKMGHSGPGDQLASETLTHREIQRYWKETTDEMMIQGRHFVNYLRDIRPKKLGAP